MRLQGHDYRFGWYFVTICAKQTEPVFEIPELRSILQDQWFALPQRFPGATLDEFIIMPDHIHFIIYLNGTINDAPTLGKVIGAYKSITTNEWLKHIYANNLQREGKMWHRDFWDDVIFDASTELDPTRQYIRNNPQIALQRHLTNHSKRIAQQSNRRPHSPAPGRPQPAT